jgi:hypothetical protein
LQVNFKNRLLGDAPNPKIIPVAGMAARLFQTLFVFLPVADFSKLYDLIWKDVI